MKKSSGVIYIRKIHLYVLAVVLLVIGCFLWGVWYGRHSGMFSAQLQETTGKDYIKWVDGAVLDGMVGHYEIQEKDTKYQGAVKDPAVEGSGC